MGAPKQRWTSEEETALRAGVEKYGAGKWRAIQRDPDFAPYLVSRSNVDLKDKWRNMNGNPTGHGHSRTRRVKKLTAATPSKLLAIMPAGEAENAIQTVPDAEAVPINKKVKRSLGPRYDELIMQAISTLKEPNGSSISEIAGYIEEQRRVPSKFKRLLTSKLTSLALQGKLIKVGKNYKVSYSLDCKPTKGRRLRRNENGGNATPAFLMNMPKRLRCDVGSKKTHLDFDRAKLRIRTAEEAARFAAQAVAEAEAAAVAAENAAREAEIAEAEAEAAEAAAQAAALAARLHKNSALPMLSNHEAVAVSVQ